MKYKKVFKGRNKNLKSGLVREKKKVDRITGTPGIWQKRERWYK